MRKAEQRQIMRKVVYGVVVSVLLSSTMLALVACHADENDPVGLAKELTDPVRRQHSTSNLTRIYTKVLADKNGNRQDPAVMEVTNAIIGPLVDIYIGHPEDNQTRTAVLSLLREMRDPRSLPVLKEALKWRAEVSEEQAISAAQTIQQTPFTDAQKPELVSAIADALASVQDARPVDNRMRIEFIRALGNMQHSSATDALVAVATRQSESQNFLINILAFEQLAKIHADSSVPALVKGLYLFDTKAPQRRANDVAALGLVGVGCAALPPLLEVLGGTNADANAIATQYLAAVRAANPAAADMMDIRMITASDATYTLGELGLPQAIDPLIAETAVVDETNPATQAISGARRLGGAIGLARIHRADADSERIRVAIRAVYDKADKQTRMQVLRAMQHLMDPGIQPFLLDTAKAPESELPDIRVIALNAFSMFANGAEAAQAQALIAAEPGADPGGAEPAGDDEEAPPAGLKELFTTQNAKALTVAVECNEDLACYIRKLADRDAMVARKAAYMIARYGRGNAGAITALIAKLDTNDATVRGDVLYALDQIADAGSQPAVERIEALQRVEEGRASWNQIKTLALATAGRLRARTTACARAAQ
jgi:hypothetical protein